jgi:hypothetical protein
MVAQVSLVGIPVVKARRKRAAAFQVDELRQDLKNFDGRCADDWKGCRPERYHEQKRFEQAHVSRL